MFLAIYSFVPLITLFHIIIHALFKSLLFLLSGSLIHVEFNFQNIFRLKMNHSFILLSFILAGSILIISLSKEGIIYYINQIFSSIFMVIIAVLGGLLTMIYTLKMYGSIYFLIAFFKRMIY